MRTAFRISIVRFLYAFVFFECFCSLLPAQTPLPDSQSFLAQFRKKLHRDRTLLSQYTYTEKYTHIDLDPNGKPKRTEVTVYQVLPGAEYWQSYRRMISKDGVALSEKELEKEDRDHENEMRKHEKKSEAELRKDREKDDREEQELLDEVFAMYDVRFVGRETIAARPAILMTFNSKPSYKPKTSDAKMIQHVDGKIWVDEEDHELVKLEAEVAEPISLGAGLLAKVQMGSRLTFERRKVNDEVWLPVASQVNLNARVLLLKGLNIREVVEYSDHKKYRVETNFKFGPVPNLD